MSATLFLAVCILGCDILLYILFQWTYGEKRRGLARRSPNRPTAMNQPDARPFVIASRRSAMGHARPLRSASRPSGEREASGLTHFNEVRAYRRIASSFA